jgi:recombination protein RecA
MGEDKANMNAAALRRQIEDTLACRVASPFSARDRAEPEVIVCGDPQIDELLRGGLPLGVLTEFVGSECSGRTSMALAYLAAVTRAGNVGAWVDAADTLDPQSAAASGVDLERLLWVRCGAGAPPAAPVLVEEAPAGAAPPAKPAVPAGGCGSPHPRSEGRDMPQAIQSMLHAHGGLYDRQIRREQKLGTPGAPNRPLVFRSADREEQVTSDRLPPRRGEQSYEPRCAEPQPKRPVSIAAPLSRPVEPAALPGSGKRSPWQALDQALRAVDLLLQSGGFSTIVLDLGSTAPEIAWRIPLATWFRFRAACERSRASLLLLTQHPCARSAAELVVRMQPGSLEADSTVMTGIRYRAEVERGPARQHAPPDKLVPIRKPPQSERGRWKGRAAWA